MGGNLRFAALLALAGATILWASGGLTRSTYRTSGSCLSYPRVTPCYEFNRDILFGLFGTRGAPMFVVPSSLQTVRLRDSADAKGLSVMYLKGGAAGLPPYDPASCPSTDTGLGLLQFEPQLKVLSGARGCPDSLYKVAFVPLPSEPLAGQIRILCSIGSRVPNCTIQDKLPNGWTASISLARTQLSEWRTASADARAFFDATLIDCGGAG